MRNPLRRLRPGRADARRRVSSRPAAPPRRFEPGRTEAKRPRRGLPWRRLAVTVIAVAGASGAVYGAGWLLTGDIFRVRAVQVTGAEVVDVQAVVQAAAVTGASMFTLDSDRAARAITELPAVKAVTVSRAWPRGVRVEVIEHQAWGYWQAGAQRVVIDADGLVLEQARPPAADAPTIVDLGLAPGAPKGVVTDPDTVRLVTRLRGDGTFERLQVHPTGYIFRRDRGLTVLVAGGPAAVLGDSDNYEFKVQTWQAVLAEERRAQRPAAFSEIDLRFGRNVVLR